MIALETNVVSKALNDPAATRVTSWLYWQNPETLFLSAVSLAELLTGVAYFPEGKRKNGLSDNMTISIIRLFERRVLSLDAQAAPFYATIATGAKKRGRAISVADCLIAAITAAHGLSVATRDVAPFEAAG